MSDLPDDIATVAENIAGKWHPFESNEWKMLRLDVALALVAERLRLYRHFSAPPRTTQPKVDVRELVAGLAAPTPIGSERKSR